MKNKWRPRWEERIIKSLSENVTAKSHQYSGRRAGRRGQGVGDRFIGSTYVRREKMITQSHRFTAEEANQIKKPRLGWVVGPSASRFGTRPSGSRVRSVFYATLRPSHASAKSALTTLIAGCRFSPPVHPWIPAFPHDVAILPGNEHRNNALPCGPNGKLNWNLRCKCRGRDKGTSPAAVRGGGW